MVVGGVVDDGGGVVMAEGVAVAVVSRGNC